MMLKIMGIICSLFAALGGLFLVGRRRKTKIMKKIIFKLHNFVELKPGLTWPGFILNTMI